MISGHYSTIHNDDALTDKPSEALKKLCHCELDLLIVFSADKVAVLDGGAYQSNKVSVFHAERALRHTFDRVICECERAHVANSSRDDGSGGFYILQICYAPTHAVCSRF